MGAADYFRKLQLQDPIVWSGVCHQGALSRVFVENDITSTFGRVEHSTLHRLPTQESISLAMIDAGATAFIVPIADNHGMSVSREVNFGLTHGASLGEVLKSTYDDVYLATRGKLKLGIQVHGQKRTH